MLLKKSSNVKQYDTYIKDIQTLPVLWIDRVLDKIHRGIDPGNERTYWNSINLYLRFFYTCFM